MSDRQKLKWRTGKLHPNYPSGNIGVFMQVTMAMVFMYLVFIGYRMMGLTGVVFVSLTFLLAVFFPGIYRLLKKASNKPKHRGSEQHHRSQPGIERKG